MNDEELEFDRSCHVLYSAPCKAQILEKIALHYPQEEREENIGCDLNDTAWFERIDASGEAVFFADGVFYYFGEGQICNFDGTTLVQGDRNPYEIVTGEIYPQLADNARKTWGLENNIYNLGHRGYVAKPGGESDAGLTYIKDLAAGKYHLPWEDEMLIKDGSIYGYPTTGGRFGDK